MFHLLRSYLLKRQRQQMQVGGHSITAELLHAAIWLLLMIALHTAAMITFEKLSIGDALWLTATTITTVGYGDLSATTLAGRLSTVLLLYVGGIFLLGKMAGDYFEFRNERKQKQICGHWRWLMQDHILILNTPAQNGEWYFSRLIQQIKSSDTLQNCAIQIVSTRFPDGLPQSLTKIEGVTHLTGDASDPDTLEYAYAASAKVIIILAREEGELSSDSRTFDILHRLRDLQTKATILAECVDERNRSRLRDVGANIVIRPIRAYPEMVVRGLIAPGSEKVIENMFTSSADEYVRYELLWSGVWKDLVCKLMQAELGLAVAYEASDGEIDCNPPANQQISMRALLIMVNEGCKPSVQQLQQALSQTP